MADERQHIEKLIFETLGVEEGKRALRELAEEHQKTAKAQEDAEARAQKSAQAQGKRLEATKTAFLGVAAGVAAAVAAGAEMVQTYARIDAANGRLQFALKKTADAGLNVESAFREARAQFKEWEKFGVSVEAQTEALTLLANESGNYAQSLGDVKLAIDVAAASGWEMERATEAVRKVRQGEVEVLKELGILTKREAEDLGKVTSEAAKTEKGIAALTAAFGDGAEGTAGLATTLESTGVKLEDTKRILGEILAELGDDTSGLLGRFAEFTGIIEDGEHPLDAMNDRLETLLSHAENGDWEKLAGALLLTNPATIPLGLGLLGISSSLVEPDLDKAKQDAFRAAGFKGTGNQVDEVPEPVPENMPSAKRPKKARGKGKGKGINQESRLLALDAAENFIAERDAAEWLEAEKTRIAMEGRQMRERDKEKALEFEQKLADDLAKIEEKRQTELAQIALDKQKQAQATQKQAVSQGIQMAGALADQVIQGEAGKAAVKAAMSAGEALVAAAFGDFRGAALHGLAAAQFSAVGGVAAAQGGSKVGAKSGTGSSGAQAGLASDRERLSLANESDRSRERAPSRTNVVNIFSTFGPSPEQSRELVDTVEREMRNRTM